GDATNVPAGLAGVAQIAAADYHSLALLSNGTVVAWGSNPYGQTNVPTGLSNVIAVAGDWAAGYAATSDGRLIGWGGSGFSGIPRRPPTGLTNLVSIACGANHIVGLNDGTPYIVSNPYNFSGYSGDTPVLNVTASGYPVLSYQWQKNGVN